MKKVIIFFVVIIITFPCLSLADNEQTLREQQEEFGITNFIQNAQKYAGDFFEDIKIDEVFNNAIKGEIDNISIWKKILRLLGNETINGIKAIVTIIIIILIHSILKSISESLENDNISKIIYYYKW